MSRFILLLSTALLFSGAAVHAAEPSEVLVRNELATVTKADYEADLLRLPEQMRSSFGIDARRVHRQIQTLIMTKSLAAQAKELKLDQDPQAKLAIQLTVDRVLSQLRLDAIEKQTLADFERDIEKHKVAAREKYLVEPDRYMDPEQVRVAHILIRTDKRTDDEAKKLAEKVRADAVGGRNFGELAREYSEDPGARKDGDLGFLAAHSVVEPFAKAAFAMTKPGEISPVVKTDFGYHIIRYAERKPARRQTFEEAKDSILADIRGARVRDAAEAHMKGLEKLPLLEINNQAIDSLVIKVPKELIKSAGTSK